MADPSRLTQARELIAACEDCGLPYQEFPQDTVLPDAEWMELHPSGEGGLLCAGCIAKRARAVPANIVLFTRLVRDSDHAAFRALKNVPLQKLACALAIVESLACESPTDFESVIVYGLITQARELAEGR